jgi:hypothetical protein
LSLKIGAQRSGLDARQAGVGVDLQHPVEATEVE